MTRDRRGRRVAQPLATMVGTVQGRAARMGWLATAAKAPGIRVALERRRFGWNEPGPRAHACSARCAKLRTGAARRCFVAAQTMIRRLSCLAHGKVRESLSSTADLTRVKAFRACGWV